MDGNLRVAIVTPYHKESDSVLEKCLESVRNQTYAECRHFVVADGFPNVMVSNSDVTHIILPTAHGDNGNLARCIGAMSAISEGFDVVAFLDADNWFRNDHIETMLALHRQSCAALCTSGRMLYRIDGTVMCQDVKESNGIDFVDTSCLCFFRPAFDLLPLWGMMPAIFSPICDRVMWDAVITRGVSRAHSHVPTVAFRTQYAGHYQGLGETPPPGCKEHSVTFPAYEAYRTMSYTDRMTLLLGFAYSKRIGAPVKNSFM